MEESSNTIKETDNEEINIIKKSKNLKENKNEKKNSHKNIHYYINYLFVIVILIITISFQYSVNKNIKISKHAEIIRYNTNELIKSLTSSLNNNTSFLNNQIKSLTSTLNNNTSFINNQINQVNANIKNEYNDRISANYEDSNKEYLKKDFLHYEKEILDPIHDRIKKNGYTMLGSNDIYFINGVIRYFKPKKLLEVGVNRGGSSVVMVNAVKDIEDAHVYSIDRAVKIPFGKGLVGDAMKGFPELSKLNKWTLYTGGVVAKFIEEIGNNIDFVYLDTAHVSPGEYLDFLMILPFLKDNCVIVFDDLLIQFDNSYALEHKPTDTKRIHFTNINLFVFLRGDNILPIFGKSVMKNAKTVAVKLHKDQKNYYLNYFASIFNYWEYLPSEEDLKIIHEFFNRVYEKKYVKMFEEALELNRNFNKRYKMHPVLKKYNDRFNQ